MILNPDSSRYRMRFSVISHAKGNSWENLNLSNVIKFTNFCSVARIRETGTCTREVVIFKHDELVEFLEENVNVDLLKLDVST